VPPASWRAWRACVFPCSWAWPCAEAQAGSNWTRTGTLLGRAAFLGALLQLGILGNRAIGFWVRVWMEGRHVHADTPSMTAPVLGFTLRLVLWTLLLLMALDNLGVNLTALLASLGLGGVAVALAVQSILGDIFASLSIALDKPFIIGDFIIVGDCIGTVDAIGLKSTQIRSLSGELIILPNSDLLKSRIRNFKQMRERRVVFRFGVSYRTGASALERIPEEVRAIIQDQDLTRFDRAHLFEFGESALVFEVVYYVLDPDYNLYMDRQQAINLGILRALEREGIRFAHPTRILVPAGEVG
jgi:small-conductance mechanosensitive channel